MHRFFSIVFAVLFFSSLSAQPSGTPGETLQRPKLVVGIVVDQMRWDFLYRYYDRYAANGG
ncbi:MAG: alkaline phosphatase family protein, partial [Chitinophagaceae bacterium]